ncbi:FABP family protein [Actinomyces polynesiensis]|uniref:FABP family protein n=1 Tax=Actinomyces polynesiensis TaxID=1325934 RepID=UPI000938A722|nr:heme-binding beta-barrel domain-containing protein [Actinomyces polynesiensis]
MMVIPADLPPELAPVAWMLGSWRGWGMLATPGEDPDRVVVEEVEADIVGTQLRLVTTVREGIARDGIDPMLDASDGLEEIIPGDVVRQETLYVKVLPGSGHLPAPGEYEPRELMASGADMDGFATLWAGVDVGPRAQLVSDAIARDSQAEDVEHLTRMYGMVAGELMWTQERTLGGEEAVIDLSGRLMRTGYARTASGEEVEGGVLPPDGADPGLDVAPGAGVVAPESTSAGEGVATAGHTASTGGGVPTSSVPAREQGGRADEGGAVGPDGDDPTEDVSRA